MPRIIHILDSPESFEQISTASWFLVEILGDLMTILIEIEFQFSSTTPLFEVPASFVDVKNSQIDFIRTVFILSLENDKTFICSSNGESDDESDLGSLISEHENDIFNGEKKEIWLNVFLKLFSSNFSIFYITYILYYYINLISLDLALWTFEY